MPLLDENGIVLVFGVTALAVLVAAIRTRSYRYPVIVGSVAGWFCGMAIYAVLALISVLTHGTGGYQFATWLAVVAIGLLPAGALGLIEGMAASLIVRLMR